MLYLPGDLLRDAVVMLLIAIVSQLLILSGDIETNPGPIGEYHMMCVSQTFVNKIRSNFCIIGSCRAH